MTETLLVLIPALPLAAAIATACLGPWLKTRAHWPVVVALPLAFVVSLVLLKQVYSDANNASSAAASHVGFEKTYTLWRWADVENAYPAQISPGSPAARVMFASPKPLPTNSGSLPFAGQSPSFSIAVTLRADSLTSMMLSMVTFISSLVAIYSIGYMHGDRGYWRFFSYIGLFVFSMTMLVSVSNFVLLYVFWEAVGLCSYLLVGFWYDKPSAVAAGKKAFLVNRVGDFCFAIGLFLVWTTYGTLDFHDTHVQAPAGQAQTASLDPTQPPGVLGQWRLSVPNGGGYVGGAIGTAICLLLLVGACGKSAQFPLYVWLPDAMEGPTPVSALIHAATMVTAGVYMIARCTPLYWAAPQAQYAVALIGGFTALFAALIALTQTDLKRVLAYSTISQLGYMFLSLGLGWLPGIIFGMFHLFTHAFFKALLFLGAGSVMHGMGGVIDMRRFGGLRKIMPITCWTFLIGCLALAGVVPFAGFWSKDGILATALQRGMAGGHGGVFGIHGLTEGGLYTTLFWAGLFTALLTAFYTFRAFFWTFCGPEKIPEEAGHHAHESPLTMTIPLMILAVCAAVVGFAFLKGFEEFFAARAVVGLEHDSGPRGERIGPHLRRNLQHDCRGDRHRSRGVSVSGRSETSGLAGRCAPPGLRTFARQILRRSDLRLAGGQAIQRHRLDLQSDRSLDCRWAGEPGRGDSAAGGHGPAIAAKRYRAVLYDGNDSGLVGADRHIDPLEVAGFVRIRKRNARRQISPKKTLN